MFNRFMASVRQRTSVGCLVAVLLVACGGAEVIAILQIVTPLAGAWNREGGNGAVSFLGANDNDALLSSTRSVQVNLDDLPAACGTATPLNGTLDSGRLTLYPTAPASSTACIEGVFTDLRRLELTVSGEPAKRVYTNDRVAVNMGGGVWSTDDGATRLKFKNPGSVSNNSSAAAEGCDVSNPAAVVGFTGTMTGFNTASLARPGIGELRGGPGNLVLFSAVDYVDGDTITLRSAAGVGLTLNRTGQDASCP